MEFRWWRLSFADSQEREERYSPIPMLRASASTLLMPSASTCAGASCAPTAAAITACAVRIPGGVKNQKQMSEFLGQKSETNGQNGASVTASSKEGLQAQWHIGTVGTPLCVLAPQCTSDDQGPTAAQPTLSEFGVGREANRGEMCGDLARWPI